MKLGTDRRTRDTAMRQEMLHSGLAMKDSGLSRRRTVMFALHRATGVTNGYQSDSSSKNPGLSVSLRTCVNTNEEKPP